MKPRRLHCTCLLTGTRCLADGMYSLPLAWTVGASLGPALGGLLANPAERYPYVFGDIELFREYKYLLPCFVAGLFPVIGAGTGWLFLKEVGLLRVVCD